MNTGIPNALIEGARIPIITGEEAAIAGVAKAVAVRVGLVVRNEGAVVAHVAGSVTIGVRLIGIGPDGTIVARVAAAVGVGIELAWVRRCGAIVEHVRSAIAIAVLGQERCGEQHKHEESEEPEQAVEGLHVGSGLMSDGTRERVYPVIGSPESHPRNHGG